MRRLKMGWLQLRRWISFLPAAFFVYIVLHYLIYQPVVPESQTFNLGVPRPLNEKVSVNSVSKNLSESLVHVELDLNSVLLNSGTGPVIGDQRHVEQDGVNTLPMEKEEKVDVLIVSEKDANERKNTVDNEVHDPQTDYEQQDEGYPVISSREIEDEGLGPQVLLDSSPNDQLNRNPSNSDSLMGTANNKVSDPSTYDYEDKVNISPQQDAQGISVKITKNNQIYRQKEPESSDKQQNTIEGQHSVNEFDDSFLANNPQIDQIPDLKSFLFEHTQTMDRLAALNRNLNDPATSNRDELDKNYFVVEENPKEKNALYFDPVRRVLYSVDKALPMYSNYEDTKETLVQSGSDTNNVYVQDTDHDVPSKSSHFVEPAYPSSFIREPFSNDDHVDSVIAPRELLSQKEKDPPVRKSDSSGPSQQSNFSHDVHPESQETQVPPKVAPNTSVKLPDDNSSGQRSDSSKAPQDTPPSPDNEDDKPPPPEEPQKIVKQKPQQQQNSDDSKKVIPEPVPQKAPEQPKTPSEPHPNESKKIIRGTGLAAQPKHFIPKTPSSSGGYAINSLKGKITVGEKYEKGFATPHEELCPSNGRDLKLLILITSAPDHEKHRNAVRQTWGHFAMRRDIAAAFVVGRTSRADVQSVIDRENDRYGDIIEANFVDHYSNLTLKTVSMFEWAKTYCSEARFVLKTDDDMFINVPLLLAFINAKRNEKHAMFGRLARGWKPVRNKKSKYYIDTATYVRPRYPDFLTGPAYLFTNDVVEEIHAKALNTTFFVLEDVLLTGFVAESLRIKRVGDSHFRNEKIRLTDTCKLMQSISIHMVKYEEQFDIYKRTLDGKTKCSAG